MRNWSVGTDALVRIRPPKRAESSQVGGCFSAYDGIHPIPDNGRGSIVGRRCTFARLAILSTTPFVVTCQPGGMVSVSRRRQVSS